MPQRAAAPGDTQARAPIRQTSRAEVSPTARQFVSEDTHAHIRGMPSTSSRPHRSIPFRPPIEAARPAPKPRERATPPSSFAYTAAKHDRDSTTQASHQLLAGARHRRARSRQGHNINSSLLHPHSRLTKHTIPIRDLLQTQKCLDEKTLRKLLLGKRRAVKIVHKHLHQRGPM